MGNGRTLKMISVAYREDGPTEYIEHMKQYARRELLLDCHEERLGIASINEDEMPEERPGYVRFFIEAVAYPYRDWSEVGG